jgi:hypothetical protein
MDANGMNEGDRGKNEVSRKGAKNGKSLARRSSVIFDAEGTSFQLLCGLCELCESRFFAFFVSFARFALIPAEAATQRRATRVIPVSPWRSDRDNRSLSNMRRHALKEAAQCRWRNIPT